MAFFISKTYLILYSVIIYNLFLESLNIDIYTSIFCIVLLMLLVLVVLKQIFKFYITYKFIILVTTISSTAYLIIRQNRLYEGEHLLLFSFLFFIICMLFHLFTNATDSFDTISFVETRDKILSYSNNYFRDIEVDCNNKEDIVQALSFILYMEDRDFFTRNKHTFSLLSVINRKFQYKLSLLNIIKRTIERLSFNNNKGEMEKEKKKI